MEAVDRFIVVHGDVVPSMNSSASGYKSGHWSTGHRLKKRWQDDFLKLFMLAEIPRNTYQYAEVSAVLTFPRALRRDADNYRMMLSKVVGDALKVGRYIPDDSPEFYTFTKVSFDKGPAKKTTLTVRAWREKPLKEE